MQHDKYDEFVNSTLREIGEFMQEELGYQSELIERSDSMPLSSLAVGIPKDAEGRDRYLSMMVMPADVEGYKVVFLQMHMIFTIGITDENRMRMETLVNRINEKFLLGSFVFFFDSLCMKYGLAFDREDGVDLLDLTRSLAVFIWQADTFGSSLEKLAAGECTLSEAVRMATGE